MLNSPAKEKELISKIKEVLSYDPETGLFIWTASYGRAVSGSLAGNTRPDGYSIIKVFRNKYYAHRLAWLFVHEAWPKDQIDHINGVRSDNRICNLRESNQSENLQNTGLRGGASKYPGVYKCKNSGKWVANIGLNGKRYRLGRFSSEEDAGKAYADAKERLHTFQPFTR